jgi:Ca2+/Na+ antiporter
MIGWLMWNGMRLMAALGLTVLAGSLVMLIWFMFDVGFAWLSFVVIGLLVLLAVFVLKRALALRRKEQRGASAEWTG